MFEAYTTFLQRLATDEAIWQASSCELVPTSQLSQRAWINATQAPVSERLLHSLFLEQAEKRPAQLAVISARRNLTYQQVLREASRLSHQLRKLGARRNQLVAVVMEKGWEQVVGVLGVLLSGAAYLPIDPHLPAERLSHLLFDAEVEVVLTQPWLEETLPWPEGPQRLCGARRGGRSQRGRATAGGKARSRGSGLRDLYLGFDRAAKGSNDRSSRGGEHHPGYQSALWGDKQRSSPGPFGVEL